MAKKGAKGGGTIRKKTVTRGGKEYTYWEARITIGRDPGTGMQLQRSFTGKTQKEVREKLQAAAVAVNDGTYTDPSRLTVGQWLDIWTRDYLINVKPTTARTYRSLIENHIRPGLGAVRLAELHPHTVQSFVNSLDGLTPASVRVVYRVLHIAMEKAVELDYIPRNPAARCVLPKAERKEIHPLTDKQAAALIGAAAGTRIEHLVTLALFTGFRLSELLGLTWDAVDFDRNTITVNKQLSADFVRGPLFATPKSGKPRTVMPAASAFQVLRKQKAKQAEQQLKAGALWVNPYGLIFTDEDGGPMLQQSAEYDFSAVRTAAGLEGFRFHDLRHTFAVNSIRAGDDIKTIPCAGLGIPPAGGVLRGPGKSVGYCLCRRREMEGRTGLRWRAFFRGGPLGVCCGTVGRAEGILLKPLRHKGILKNIQIVRGFHCRQSLRLTIVIRRLCLYSVKLYQNRHFKLAIITYCRYQQADLRRWPLS